MTVKNLPRVLFMRRLTIVTGAVGIFALAGLFWYSYNQIQRNKDIIREKKEEIERNKQITTPTADSSEIVAIPPPVTNSNSELTPSLAPPTPKETIDIDWNSRSYFTAQMPAKSIALTLDDGPSNKYTEQVLDILKQHQIQATFFLVGYRVKENCPLVNRIVREGHTLGNHTYHHPILTQLSAEEQKVEMETTQTAIKNCGIAPDKLPRWLRTPYGAQDETTLQIAHQVGLNTALWTVDTNDWRKTATSKSIAEEVLKSQGQDIVLMHDATDANLELKSPESSDTRQNTVDALTEIIPQLQKQGFQFVTLEEAFPSQSLSKPEVK
ncbi:MAG: polysaccharide deacetylase family protein [Prochloron sp. SP5CPC1]|nr:polysaccharide deacetylase family protein [Candidatus Paraprochloron terpiosi SP5CPC1]